MPGFSADLVLTNGKVWRGLYEGLCESVAVWQGRVLAAGAGDDVADLIGPDTRVVDLAGRFATPGLNDAHLHLLPLGLTMAELDLRPAHGVTTLDELLRHVREAAERTPPGGWIRGRGYDHFRLDVGRHPLISKLDAVAPDHPVFLVRADGHLAVCNRRAFALAGIDDATATPEGGLIERRDGALTGLIAETALHLVEQVAPKPDEDALVAAIERAGLACLAHGITSVTDAAVGMRAGFAEIPAYFRAAREGRLPVRTLLCLLGGPAGIVEACRAAGLITGTGSDRLRIGPVKLFTDGSAGGRTAAMMRPYLGEPSTDGILCFADADLDAQVGELHAAGYQMAIHAIGDRAIEQTLRAYEHALDRLPAADRRHRIEHCGWLDDGQMARMVERGIEPVPQPVFMRDFGDLYLDVLGEDRPPRAYPMRSWLNAGQHPAASTDSPVCDLDPMPNLWAMLTRRTLAGTLLGGQEALTAAEALHCYTYNSAYVGHAETSKGRLMPGQLADIAVWSHDLLETDPDTLLRAARCDLTLLDGEIVYERP
jgi:predicted amidohydrolase YtcJ